MVEASDEHVRLRVMCLNVAQVMLQTGIFCAHEYLDEARKMFDFIMTGVAPLPPEDHADRHDPVPNTLAELFATAQSTAQNVNDDEQWSDHYDGSGGHVDAWFGDHVARWVDGAPTPPEDDE